MGTVIFEKCGCSVDGKGRAHRCELHELGHKHAEKVIAETDPDDQLWPPRESFPEWLDRQIIAARAMYDSTKTAARRQRHWDMFLLLQGVKAEYERRRLEPSAGKRR